MRLNLWKMIGPDYKVQVGGFKPRREKWIGGGNWSNIGPNRMRIRIHSRADQCRCPPSQFSSLTRLCMMMAPSALFCTCHVTATTIVACVSYPPSRTFGRCQPSQNRNRSIFWCKSTSQWRAQRLAPAVSGNMALRALFIPLKRRPTVLRKINKT